MRPGNQSNKRMRGRGRKGPNPLTRTYESNGPDVKIRGTAMHIAEKYQQLARDAQASGDRVMFESYNQHAEHYLRIVAAAQPPQQQQNTQPHAKSDSEDGQEQAVANGSAAPAGEDGAERGSADAPAVDPDSPQPFIENMPVINQEGQVNGAGQDEGEEKPRRRARTPRTRVPRGRAAAETSAEGGEPVEASQDAEVPGAEEAQPKPRRRVTRPRRTKAAEETSEEAPVPGE